MWAITRRGHVGAPCARVERCLYVYLLRRRRRVLDEIGDEAKGWEESIAVVGGVVMSSFRDVSRL